MEQMARESLATVSGMGVDGLEAGDATPGIEDPQAGMHLATPGGAEPGAMAPLAYAAYCGHSALEIPAMARTVLGLFRCEAQSGGLGPVAVTVQGSERGGRRLACRRCQGRGRQHRVRVHAQPERDELLERLRRRGGTIEADRDVVGAGERSGEP